MINVKMDEKNTLKLLKKFILIYLVSSIKRFDKTVEFSLQKISLRQKLSYNFNDQRTNVP